METNKELLNLQTNVENVNENKEQYSNVKELVEREQVEDTAFYIVGNAEKGYALFVGEYIISDWTHNKTELIVKVNKKDWSVLMGLIGAVIQYHYDVEEKKQIKKDENYIENVLKSTIGKD